MIRRLVQSALLAPRTTLAGFALTAALSGLAAGCGSPLVGLSCKDGYTDCGGSCVDLRSDEHHCGTCSTSCGAEFVCELSLCIPESQADGGGADGGRDAGTDGSTDSDADLDGGGGGDDAGSDGGGQDGDIPDAMGFPDVTLPPLCMGPSSPVDCVCGLGQLKCGDICVNAASDHNNCGACNHACAPLEVCAGGSCAVTCAAQGLASCGGACVDTTNDPDHCGSCTTECPSGLCVNSACLGATVGHVIVVGHDLSASREALRRVAGNAIFLPGGNPLRVLLYEEFANGAVQAGVRSTIQFMAGVEGRMSDLTVAQSALTVPFLMGQTDVFVVAAQAGATDDMLVKDGETWGRAMREFVGQGGVVVLFDGGGTNAGTYQILDTAGLFSARSRTSLTRRALALVAPGDAVASFVQLTYQSEGETVGFDTDETTVVVRDPMSHLPVVVHIAR